MKKTTLFAAGLLLTIMLHGQSTGIIVAPNSNTANISWTIGDSTDRVAFIRETSSGSPTVSEGQHYTAALDYGNGSLDETGNWYCIYNGSEASPQITVTGLTPSTTYRVQVIEYSGSAGSQSYDNTTATGNPVNFTTTPLSPPVIELTYFNAKSNDYQVTELEWDGSSKNAVFLKQSPDTSGFPSLQNGYEYVPSSKFGQGEQLGTSGWYCVYSSGGNLSTIYNLSPQTQYTAVILSYSGNGYARVYNDSILDVNQVSFTTSQLVAPATQVKINNVVSYTDQFQLGLDDLESPDSVIIFMKTGTSGTFVPDDATAYTDSSTFGTSPVLSGDWYCVYQGYGSQYNFTGITANTSYRVAAYAYSAFDGVRKINTTAGSNNVKTIQSGKPPPSLQSSDLTAKVDTHSVTLTFTPGNGEKRMVFMKKNGNNTPPVEHLTSYSAESRFGVPLSLIGEDWYCVYNGAGDSVVVTNLNSLTGFRAGVYEYNNTSGAQQYNLDSLSNNLVDFTTEYNDAPEIPPNGITMKPLATRLRFIYNKGDGYGLVIMVSGNASGLVLDDSTFYDPDPVYGTPGSKYGDWYCVYNGDIGGAYNDLEITGLSPGTTYNLAFVSFNNRLGYENFREGVEQEVTMYNKVLDGTASASGDWDPAGLPTDNSSVVVAAGSLLSENPIYNNLTLVPYSSGIHVEVPSNSTLTLNGSFTSNGIGLYVDGQGGLINGDQDIPVKVSYTVLPENWLTFALPFKGPSIISSIQGKLYVKYFDETKAQFIYPDNFFDSRGLLFYATEDESLTFSGTVSNDVSSPPLTYTPGDPYSGFNLVANPYMANLDWKLNDSVGTWSRTNLEPTIWVWNSSSGNYASYNRDTDVSSGGANQYIAPMQSFWVQASATNPALTIRPGVRVAAIPGFYKSSGQDTHIRLKASLSSGYSDEAIVGFRATTGPSYNSQKLTGNFDAPQLYSLNGEQRLSMNFLPENLFQESEFFVPLGFQLGIAGEVNLDISVPGLPEGFRLQLQDRETGENILLSEGNQQYTFFSAPGSDPNRFALSFKREAVTGQQNTLSTETATPYPRIYSHGTTLYIISKETNPNASLAIYDLSGRLQWTSRGITAGTHQVQLELKTGLYLVQIRDDKGMVTEKVWLAYE